jgi:hypothetical protein
MSLTTTARRTALSLALGITASVALGTVCATAGAAPLAVPHSTVARATAARQLLGHVSGPTFLEASVPAAGRYALQYDIEGTAAFDTYLNGTELGYVGGPTGTYQTRTVQLPAGGLLVQVAGPEGSGQASVYLVRTS